LDRLSAVIHILAFPSPLTAPVTDCGVELVKLAADIFGKKKRDEKKGER
jgi:hypothetical protein